MSGGDDPEVRRRLMEAVDGYTTIYRKGRTPPDTLTSTSIRSSASGRRTTTIMP